MLFNYGLTEKIIACQAISAGQVLMEECGRACRYLIDTYSSPHATYHAAANTTYHHDVVFASHRREYSATVCRPVIRRKDVLGLSRLS